MRLSEAQGISKVAVLGVVKALEARGFQPGQVMPFLKTLHEQIRGLNPMAQTEWLKRYGAESLHVVLAMKDMNEQLEKVHVVGKSGVDVLDALGNKARELEGDFRTGFNEFATKYAPDLIKVLDNMKTAYESIKPQVSELGDLMVKGIEKTVEGWRMLLELIKEYRELTEDKLGIHPEKNKDPGWAKALEHPDSGGILGLAGQVMASTNINHFNITLHGVTGGPASIAEAIAAELKHLFKGTEAQHPKNGY